MKSIPELKAEEARVRAILDGGVEAQLRAIPGVVHVSVGLKQINGTATDEFSIRVYVQEKKDPNAIPPAERIPKRIQGIPTDVNEVKVFDPHLDASSHRPITGGIQISDGIALPDGTFSVGTLGCLATDGLDGKTVLLTNFHVIGGTPGAQVFQPLTGPGDLIGTVKRGGITGTTDAAIAEVAAGIATTGDEINTLFLNGSNHVAGVSDPAPGERVFKVGRTTGLTDGKVVDPDAPSSINYPAPTGLKSFTHVILIQCTKVSGCCCCTCDVADSSKAFSDHGDSGSAVLNAQRMAVGLIMGGDGSESIACRMSNVETALNITVNRTIPVGPAIGVVQPADAGVPVSAPAGGSPFAARAAAAGAPPSAEDESLWATMQRRLEESPFGSEIGMRVRHHLPEGIELVNHHRAVMVAWQRAQGPSFLAQWMNGIRNPSQPLPKEINGVSMNSALLTMATVLKTYGSTELQQSIDTYGLDLMALLDRATTVDELIESIDKPVMV